MKIFIDTEFNDYKGELISMALVAENGREWYGVRKYTSEPTEWVAKNVVPHLNRNPEDDVELAIGIDNFLNQFDSVYIIADWPTDIAHFCNFIEFRGGERVGPNNMTFEIIGDLPGTAGTSLVPHNALEDARALAKSYKLLAQPLK